LGVSAFAQRMLGSEYSEFADKLIVAGEGEVGLDAVSSVDTRGSSRWRLSAIANPAEVLGEWGPRQSESRSRV
jgi:hypothetical protein